MTGKNAFALLLAAVLVAVLMGSTLFDSRVPSKYRPDPASSPQKNFIVQALERFSAKPAVSEPREVWVLWVKDPAELKRSRAAMQDADIIGEIPGGFAHRDGRLWATDSLVVNQLLRGLSWTDRELRMAGNAGSSFQARRVEVAPAKSSGFVLSSLADARNFVAAHPRPALAGLLFVLLVSIIHWSRQRRVPQEFPEESLLFEDESGEAGATGSGFSSGVRIVLVRDREALAQIRLAIGDAEILYEADNAIALADGWILAAREGTIWELLVKAGWIEHGIGVVPPEQLSGVLRNSAGSWNSRFRVGMDQGGVLTTVEAIRFVASLPLR